ncbi:MAG: glycosyltransferase family 39 protein, partial [Planctomycetota bacterium]
EYYERYPALGLVHWPPLFYAVEGVGFLLGGVSVVTAKAVVIFFVLVFVLYFYRLLALCFSRAVAFAATALALLTPQVVYYGRAVMLEVPVLAMCTAASYYFYRALYEKKKWPALACGMFLAAALLTKQHAAYLLPFFAVYAVLSGRAKELFTARWIAPVLIVLVFAGGYYAFALSTHGSTLVKDAVGGGAAAGDWTWYLRTLPKQIGSRANPYAWPSMAVSGAALLALAGSVVWCVFFMRKATVTVTNLRISPDKVGVDSVISDSHRNMLFFVCQAVCCFVFFSAMSQKDSRHIIFWVPPLVALLVVGIRNLGIFAGRITKSSRAGFVVAWGLIVLLLLHGLLEAATTRKEYVRGYEQAAKRVLLEQRDGTVFFSGYLNGNFIFFVRKNDPSRSVAVSRASRDLFSTEIMAKYGTETKVSSAEDVVEVLCKKGVRHIIVEDRNLFDGGEAGRATMLLSEVLKDETRARFLYEVPVDSNIEKYRGLLLKVYTFKP